MKKTGNIFSFYLVSVLMIYAVEKLQATPSTQIWNPSTDIQAIKTVHLGIDNYFSAANNHTKPLAAPTDLGLTYGLFKNIEIGIDYFGPATDPLFYNAKYGIAESQKMMFSVAVGGMNFGGKKDSTDANILYGVAAKNIGKIGRLSLGYYSGNAKVLMDETGTSANTGMIASFDKQISDKVWGALDYASGTSSYGTLSFGASYSFAQNTSIIFGYVIYNNQNLAGINNQLTTQLDINF
ncbi:MAG: hypothetical protein A3J83_06345 [Elusimicrobia bacterium RIFOXYA2_FULL_40_6]|nr:MAG: hypothetical protein A3J83_06345 [Elusimicrobia bacterium RIFOXYA2_FULL_40_6]